MKSPCFCAARRRAWAACLTSRTNHSGTEQRSQRQAVSCPYCVNGYVQNPRTVPGRSGGLADQCGDPRKRTSPPALSASRTRWSTRVGMRRHDARARDAGTPPRSTRLARISIRTISTWTLTKLLKIPKSTVELALAPVCLGAEPQHAASVCSEPKPPSESLKSPSCTAAWAIRNGPSIGAARPSSAIERASTRRSRESYTSPPLHG